MSAQSAGVRELKTFQDRTIDVIRDNEQNFIQALKVAGTEQGSFGIVGLGETSGGAPQDAPGNFLETGGGTMIGPIAYFPVTVNIIDDASINDDSIDVSFGSTGYSTYVKVVGIAATDDLVNILGAQHDGQDLIIQGTTGKTITLKTTGNIIPPDGVDFDLVDTAMIRLIFDPDTNKWISNFAGGTSAITNQIIQGNTRAFVLDAAPAFFIELNGVPKFQVNDNTVVLEDLDITGVESIRFHDDPGTADMLVMGATSAQVFAIDMLDATEILDFTFAGDPSFRITDGRIQVFSISPDTLSASMSFFRDDPSPAIGNALADIDFDGKNSGGFFHTYASILGGIEAITDGSEKGAIVFQVAGGSPSGGALVQRVRIETDFVQLFDTSLIFDTITDPTTAFTNSTQGQFYAKDLGGGVSEPFWRDDAGTVTGLFSAVTNEIIQGNTFARVLDAAPGFFIELNGVPKFQVNDNTVVLEDLDITGIEVATFHDDAGTGDFLTMGATSSQIFAINILDVNDILDITFAGDLSARFTDGRFQLFSAVPNTQSASMSMFRDDPSPGVGNALADLDFDGRNSNGDFITYVQLLGGIGDPLLNNEEGNFTIQVQGGLNGILVQAARFGHTIAHNTAIFNDAFIEMDEVVIPPDPAANKGRIYLKTVGGTHAEPFFLDELGTETNMIAAGGGSSFADDVFDIHDDATPSKILQFQLVNLLASTTSFFATEPITVAGKTWTLPNINGTFIMTAGAQTLTATKTWENGTNNAILIKEGGKLEFETAGATGVNFEIQGQTGMRDPEDLTITNRAGLEIDINTGTIPDTEVFGIGDGEANPWFLIDDDSARFNSARARPYQFFLSRNNIPSNLDFVCDIFGQAKKDSTTYFKYGIIRIRAITVDTVAATNVGSISLGAVSNNVLNTGFTIEGLSGNSAVALAFHNVTPTAQQTLASNPTTTQISTVLRNLGLTKL